MSEPVNFGTGGEAVAARYKEDKPNVAAAIRAAPRMADRARQYTVSHHEASSCGATVQQSYDLTQPYSGLPRDTNDRP